MFDTLFLDYDYLIFYFLSVFGALSSLQVARLVFAGVESSASFDRTPRRVLHRLFKAKTITRLDRTIGGKQSGSKPYVYQLTKIGYRRIRSLHPASIKVPPSAPSRLFIEHTIAIAEIGVRLIEAQRAEQLKILSLETEPLCWRTYMTLYGDVRVLKPDLFVALSAGDYDIFAFIEVDRGTESLATVLKKCVQYQEYMSSGSEQVKHGLFPYIVWSAHTNTRAQAIKKAIVGDARLNNSLFMVATADTIIASLLADPQ